MEKKKKRNGFEKEKGKRRQTLMCEHHTARRRHWLEGIWNLFGAKN
jgi:hypothetical protein